ncbi:MAG: heparinase II/III family protein [Candidatus Saccharibacteria bacterium]|nr:heparinase II/III family protein [Pseudorhodobacter sp.]
MADIEQKRRSGGWRDRWAMWRALKTAPSQGFLSQPEPRTIGLYARGKQLLAGNFVSAGIVVARPGVPIWDVDFADPAAAIETHGFAWLDDLAAVGDQVARERAQAWLALWIERYGRGRGPGWTSDLIGRRLIRLINHALMLFQNAPDGLDAAYFRTLSAQTVFLAKRWQGAPPGLPRFEALTGLISASLALDGMQAQVGPALAALAQDCGTEIDIEGGIPTRNPEELLEIFTLLTWAAQALAEAGQIAPPDHMAAMERIAPTLRSLRHADGSLARFQGGGRGAEGRLDTALANAGVKAVPSAGMAMGFVRLSGGRTTIIVDAAAPPGGAAGRRSHASTNAFELTSGRRPVVVCCGSGLPFGREWRLAGRATASHSTLAVEGFSSSRLGPDPEGEMAERAEISGLRLFPGENGTGVHVSHNGWARTHGMSHVRDLMLTHDGRHLTGVDKLAAITTPEKRRFEKLMIDGRLKGFNFAVRFHVHPDVEARLDLGGTAVSLALKSGEIWVFRQLGPVRMTLEPSIYLEKARLRPRQTVQIVLAARVLDFESEVVWTLAKAQDTPLAIRDLEREDVAGQI